MSPPDAGSLCLAAADRVLLSLWHAVTVSFVIEHTGHVLKRVILFDRGTVKTLHPRILVLSCDRAVMSMHDHHNRI